MSGEARAPEIIEPRICHAPSREWPHPPHDWTGLDWTITDPAAPVTFGIWRCCGGIPIALPWGVPTKETDGG
jgi:hypothetical protein